MPKPSPLKADDLRVIDEGGIFPEIEVTAGETTVRAVLDNERLQKVADAIGLYLLRVNFAAGKIRQGGKLGEMHAQQLRNRTPADVFADEARKELSR